MNIGRVLHGDVRYSVPVYFDREFSYEEARDILLAYNGERHTPVLKVLGFLVDAEVWNRQGRNDRMQQSENAARETYQRWVVDRSVDWTKAEGEMDERELRIALAEASCNYRVIDAEFEHMAAAGPLPVMAWPSSAE